MRRINLYLIGYWDGYYDCLDGYNYDDAHEFFGYDIYAEGYEDGWLDAEDDLRLE